MTVCKFIALESKLSTYLFIYLHVDKSFERHELKMKNRNTQCSR